MQILRLRHVAALAATALAGLALTHVAHAADGPAALDKAPQTPAMRDSVITVDSLITSENRLALAHSKEQSIAAGLTQPAPKAAAPAGPPPGSISVVSIYGIENDLRANINFNGESYERVRAGARLGSCVITAINGRSVVLKAARKGVPAAACPSGKWTGVTPVPTGEQMADRVRATLGAMPSPALPTPFSSVGSPTLPLQASARGPAPLRVNQPTVQLIPGGPLAPGQTSIPLIPRQLEPVLDERLQTPPATN
ncbi:hypothetical protein LJR290_007760 [Variovorax sp. LjRoot290]|uniref:hypothetical protein n=1 Tax=unclassified Variovorax TaxID=663243 RepID=UPI003ECE14CB